MDLRSSDKKKNSKLKIATKAITIILLSLGTVTLFFSKETSLVVYILSFISLITGFIINHKSDLDSAKKEELIDYMSQILSKDGKGSPYLERAKKHIEKDGSLSKDFIADVEKAYYLNKDDIEAAELFFTIKTITFVHHKVYGKPIAKEYVYLKSLEKELKQAIAKRSKIISFHNCLAIVYDYMLEFKKARKHYDIAGKLGGYPSNLSMLTTSHLMSGEFIKALSIARLALKNRIYTWHTYFSLGRVHSSLGNYVQASKYLEIARAIGGNYYELLQNLSEAYLHQEKYFKFLKIRLLIIVDSIVNFSIRGAISNFMLFVLFVFIGIFFHLGKLSILIAQKIPVLRDIRNPFLRLDIHEYAIVPVQIERGLFRSAIKTYKRAITKMPSRADNYNNLAACYLFLDKNELAKQAIISGIKHKYNNSKELNEKLDEVDAKMHEVRLDIRNYRLNMDKLKLQVQLNETNNRVLIYKST